MLEVVRPPHGAARRGRGAPLLAAAGLAALLFVLMRRNADHTAQPARNDTATEKAQAESSRWPKRRVRYLREGRGKSKVVCNARLIPAG